MTKAQIKYLRLLGYEDTKEDGAILQHKRLYERFVWRGESFQDVLRMYSARLAYSVKKEIINKVTETMISERRR